MKHIFSTLKLTPIWSTFVILIALFALFDPGNGELICNKTFAICDDECYDPATLHCLESGKLKFVCPKEMKVCGDTCYDPTTHVHCLQDKGLSAVCSKNHRQCSTQCFSPETEQCLNESVVCKLDEKLCGRKHCYKPLTFVEHCTAKGRVCLIGEDSCGKHCYVPSHGITCHFNKILCHDGRKICGEECYLESAGEICVDEKAICREGQTLCGDHDCYYENEDNKCFIEKGQESIIATVCKIDENACSGKCYNPETGSCFKFRGLGQVCPKGQLGCGGTACYSPERGEDICLTNSNGDEQLCKRGQKLCGSICYSPGEEPEEGSFTCHKNKGVETLCRNEQLPCGSECYNVETEVCHPTTSTDSTSLKS